MKQYRIYIFLILILIIGILHVKYELKIDGEFGFIESFFLFLGWMVIAILLIIHFSRWRLRKPKTKYNFAPIITTIILVVLVFVANRITSIKLNRKNRFVAITTIRNNGNTDSLQLKINGEYFAQINELEWGYRQSGKYIITNDTLYLDKNVNSDLGQLVFPKMYKLSKDKKYFIPIINQISSNDSSNWLTIYYSANNEQ